MWNTHRLGPTLVAFVLLIAMCGAASASPIKPLSKVEFAQLKLAQSRIHSLESSDARSFQKANAVCSRMRDVSPLISSVRSGCLDLIRLGGDYAKLNARATKCGIDPSSESAILTCLVPAVQSYYTDAEAFYRAESRVNRLAIARGFSSACVAVIGDSRANLAAEGRLAGDLKAAVAALRAQNPQALQTLSGQINDDIKAITPGPSSLSLCPRA